MKKSLLGVLLSCMLAFTVFGQTVNPGSPVEKSADILKNNNSFLDYIGDNLKLLSANYTAYDDHSNVISKGEFLRELTTGNYLFIRLVSNNSALYFKLYKLDAAEKKAHGDEIYAYTRFYYDDYKRVGKKFPAFDFTDINGNRYTSQNTKGKIVVLKCWFIGCQACAAEMPALNELMQTYKNRKDIIFISLAPDTKAKLQAFFSNKRFDYAKVPGQNAFISNMLKVQAFPTHFIINKQGIIVNVVDSPEELKYSLKHDI